MNIRNRGGFDHLDHKQDLLTMFSSEQSSVDVFGCHSQ